MGTDDKFQSGNAQVPKKVCKQQYHHFTTKAQIRYITFNAM